MKKKEIQGEVDTRLSNGESKTATFKLLSGQGVSDRVVANMIASHASPELCRRHSKLIDAMIVISWLQLALMLLLAIAIGLSSGLVATLIVAAFVGAFGYLFVWGFTHDKAWAYNVTILLVIVNLPKALTNFMDAPVASLVGLALSAGLLAFTWYVRGKVFPDFAFVWPKKLKGEYVFST